MAGYAFRRINSNKHSVVDFFGFPDEGERDADALDRARRYYQKCIDENRARMASDEYSQDFKEFLRKRTEEYTACLDNLQIEAWEAYEARQRAVFLAEPKEITEAEWWRQYEVLPPAGLLMCDRFTEFYISEAFTGTWHSGYLHDHKTGKYWTSLVDACDRLTRLCVRLGIAKEG